ncbi:MAG: hypothetical protein OZ917_08355 [Candidatus Brocadiaceae bacterium]|nr:hypothetical protein [Candidatus Brocadiaceae bacterium]
MPVRGSWNHILEVSILVTISWCGTFCDALSVFLYFIPLINKDLRKPRFGDIKSGKERKQVYSNIIKKLTRRLLDAGKTDCHYGY